MEFPEETQQHENCPKDSPFLCGTNTLARGLCLKDKGECVKRTVEKRPTLIIPEDAAGKQYGYFSEFLGKGCYIDNPVDLKIDYQKTYLEYDTVPLNFSLLTYNIWGLSSKPTLIKLFKLRKPLLLKTLTETNADMFCLQEMSIESYKEMADWISTYKFASELPFPANKVQRNRNVDVYFVSKYRPKRITVYGIKGVLGYENSLIVIEYPNLVIFNIYNQAGSKHSIGQEKTWIHYSRCRYDILNIIYDMLPENKNTVICGDFNFDLDGTIREWPEQEMIEKFKTLGFVDTYRRIRKRGGLTEDTDLNLMRWNQKLIEKKYRYDAILYKGNWQIANSRIIGTDLNYLNEEESEWFYEELSEATTKDRLRGTIKTKKGLRLPINASDHFGVLTKFRNNKNRRTRRC